MYILFGRRYDPNGGYNAYADWLVLGYYSNMSEVEWAIGDITAKNRDMANQIDWDTYSNLSKEERWDKWENRVVEIAVSKMDDIFECLDVDV